jgi:hypothetical protein
LEASLAQKEARAKRNVGVSCEIYTYMKPRIRAAYVSKDGM